MKRSTLLAVTALTTLLTGNQAVAQDNVSSRLRALENEISVLKRQQEVSEEVAKSKAEKQASVEVGKKGLAVTSPDKNFSLKVRGYTQIDSRQFISDKSNSGKDDILARRVRPVIEGTAFKDFSYRVMPDFAGSSPRIFDAHIDYKASDPLQFRIGKFKPPIGLERLQSATDIAFIERGHPTNLAPSRDLGFQVYGDLDVFEYQVGVFNGTVDLGNGDTDDDDKKDYVARVFAHPFKETSIAALQGLGVGIAGSVGDREGTSTKALLPEYKTPGQQTFFKYRSSTTTPATGTTFASGENTRIYPQAYYYYSNFGLLGEYAISEQEVRRGAATATLDNRAWQVIGSVVLTGEDANYKGGVKPEQPFSLENGTWGAFELVGRVGETDIDDDAFPIFADITASATKARSYGAGINWHLNENVKLALDYEQTNFDGGATVALGGDRPDEKVVFTRAQFRF